MTQYIYIRTVSSNLLLYTAHIVESVHFFLVILVILLTAEPVRILKMEVPQVSNFEFFTAEPLNFHYCWTFEILDLLVYLLLNLWTFFTAEPLRLSVAAEPLDFLYCWTFEVMPWIMYLFTAEPLRLSVCFWTFGFSLLLNLWIFFTAEHLRLCPEIYI